MKNSNLYQSTEDAQIEYRALADFFRDYCLTSKNRSLSRGFLNGLQSLVCAAASSSDIAQASKIVAFANFSKQSCQPRLAEKAKTLYYRMLHTLQSTISDTTKSDTVELLISIVLLGLYEVRWDDKRSC